jgi:hypothetical protein
VKRRASLRSNRRSPQQKFHDEVFRRRGAICLMCKHHPAPASVREARPQDFDWLQAAHILPKRDLAGDEKSAPANGLVLCVWHHNRNDRWIERVPRELLPAEAVAWAESKGLLWQLDREYPPTPERRPA